MAIIKNTITGSGLSGSAGDLYFRIQNGKQVFCSKPTHYTVSQDERSVKNRSNMFYLSRVSKSVNREKFFHKMWFLKELKGTGPYHKFLSYNHPHQGVFDLAQVSLAPRTDFTAELESYSLEGCNFNIKFKAIGDGKGIDTIREPFIAGAGFIFGAPDSDKDPYTITTIPLQKIPLNLNAPFEFSKTFTEAPDKVHTILFLLSTLNSTDEPVKYSNTLVITK